MPLPVLLPYRAHNGMFGVGLVLVTGRLRVSCRPGEEITCQRPDQRELAASRYRRPVSLQVPHAPDSRGDRLVIDTGEQVLQRRVAGPGHALPGLSRGVRAITPAVGHAVGDRLGPAVSRLDPLTPPPAGPAAPLPRRCSPSSACTGPPSASASACRGRHARARAAVLICSQDLAFCGYAFIPPPGDLGLAS
jgi:hypothetical protein